MISPRGVGSFIEANVATAISAEKTATTARRTVLLGEGLPALGEGATFTGLCRRAESYKQVNKPLMPLHPPDELMVQEFLPAVRQLVARHLHDQGLSQNRIASVLGVTQASVSMYLAEGRKGAYESLAAFSLSRDDADRLAESLSEDARRRPEDAVATLLSVWTRLLGRGSVCPRHRALRPELAECDFCVVKFGGEGSASDAVSEVGRAVRTLESSSELVAVMPEVSVNLALAPAWAESPADVVAVPGRIVKLKGRPKAILPPEPGASSHLSRVLLVARGAVPAVRACLNLRYDKRMARVLASMGVRCLQIGGYPASGQGDSTVDALERRLRGRPGAFDAVVDLGTEGVEPNVYLFGTGAREVAELAVRIARAYSGDRAG